MNDINIPGFTAEHSLYGDYRQTYAYASDTRHPLAPEIVPQGCIVLDGVLVCDLPGIPTDPRSDARCRARCYRTFHGAALKECLGEC
jgi:hypothetical protein